MAKPTDAELNRLRTPIPGQMDLLAPEPEPEPLRIEIPPDCPSCPDGSCWHGRKLQWN